MIQARLNQLSPGARQLANMAAVIGRSFSPELLALASHSAEESLAQNLDELWQRRIVREQGAYYDLCHDRIRDVAYAEIPPARRKLLHHHVAEALAQRYEANLDDVSPQLAYHYEAAGLLSEAVGYYLQAGEAAQRVYANDQACDLLNRGIAIINLLPSTSQRDRQAVSLYATLATSLRVIKGWTSAEMYETVNRAWQLSDKLNDSNQNFRLIKFLFDYHFVRGDLDQASQLAEQVLEIVEQDPSIPFFTIAYNYQAAINLYRGELKRAQEQLKKSLNYYDPQHHETYILLGGLDYSILSLVYRAHNLWLLGFPDQALSVCLEAVDLTQALNHPSSQALALAYLAMLYQFRQETDQVAKYADTCLAVVARYSFAYYHQWANILLAWTRALKNPTSSGLLSLQNALHEFQAIDAGVRWPFYLSLLAVFYEQTGQLEEGLETINEALSAAARHNENWWNAELYRLRGNLLLLQGSSDLALEAYRQAISLALEQEALSLQLRAATSLARLWHMQGRAAQAHELLTAVYRQFTEGFDTPDLQEAQALLTDLTN